MPNVVNLAKKTPATHMLVVRHRDRPGVLAHVFDRLRSGGINVQETENVIFEGAQAAVARINLDGAPPDDAAARSVRQCGHSGLAARDDLIGETAKHDLERDGLFRVSCS